MLAPQGHWECRRREADDEISKANTLPLTKRGPGAHHLTLVEGHLGSSAVISELIPKRYVNNHPARELHLYMFFCKPRLRNRA